MSSSPFATRLPVRYATEASDMFYIVKCEYYFFALKKVAVQNYFVLDFYQCFIFENVSQRNLKKNSNIKFSQTADYKIGLV